MQRTPHGLANTAQYFPLHNTPKIAHCFKTKQRVSYGATAENVQKSKTGV